MSAPATIGKAQVLNRPTIVGYGCTSAAGEGVAAFWHGLSEGRDFSEAITLPSSASARACRWKHRAHPEKSSVRQLLITQLLSAWREVRDGLPGATLERIARGGRLGVILASTKGEVDDWVWGPDAAERRGDPLTPLLDGFLAQAELAPARSLCVSNACASSHSALLLASRWLDHANIEDVLVIAADAVGPFVLNGFHCLRALSPEHCRPFDGARSGLQLGEAAAAILLSNRHSGGLSLRGVGLDVEGFAVTRPSGAGDSLRRACLEIRALADNAPDIIVAHGTGTLINDAAEDAVFSSLWPSASISATKGSIGHTLGASGAMDVIAACETLRRGRFFAITGTREIDHAFPSRNRYVVGQGPNENNTKDGKDAQYKSAVVSSLGFGGVHAAAWIDRVAEVSS